MVYGGRGGNDAHSAFSVSRSTSTTKMPDMSKLQLDRYGNTSYRVSISGIKHIIGIFLPEEPSFNTHYPVLFRFIFAILKLHNWYCHIYRLSLEDCNEINEEPSVEEMKAELTNCIYLQDSTTQIYGLKIYGTPWQPEFCGWAFNLPRGQVNQ